DGAIYINSIFEAGAAPGELNCNAHAGVCAHRSVLSRLGRAGAVADLSLRGPIAEGGVFLELDRGDGVLHREYVVDGGDQLGGNGGAADVLRIVLGNDRGGDPRRGAAESK